MDNDPKRQGAITGVLDVVLEKNIRNQLDTKKQRTGVGNGTEDVRFTESYSEPHEGCLGI